MVIRYTARVKGPATVYDKLWLPTELPDTCINYPGAPTEYGYCRILDPNSLKLIRAHRVAYCKHNNVLLESIADKLIMHSCDNRCCVNPNHLKLGTDLENSQDMIAKGRDFHKTGVDCGASKLNDDIVRKIRADQRAYRYIAKHYSIGVSTVCQIKQGKTWKHVV